MVRRFSIVPVVLALLATLVPGAASAAASPIDTYFAQVAQALRANHVYVDPQVGTTFTDSQASALASQIKATRKPIYVAFLGNGILNTIRTSLPKTLQGETPAQLNQYIGKRLPEATHNALGGSNAIGVASPIGFYANGFNLVASTADQVGPAANTAITQSQDRHTDHKSVPSEVLSNWVTLVAPLNYALPSSSRSSAAGTARTAATPAPAQQDPFPWGKFLLIVGGILLLGLALVAVVVVLRRRQGLERVGPEIDQLRTEANDTRSRHSDPRFNAVYSALDAAEAARSRGDLSEAEDFLRQAKKHLATIERNADAAELRTVQHHDADLHRSVSPSGGSSATGSATSAPQKKARPNSVARVQRPDGQTVIVNNNTYTPMPTQQAGYNHYLATGGWYGGVYYGPGFYVDPFWTYNWLAWDLMFDDLLIAEQLQYSNLSWDAGFAAGEQAAEQQAVATGVPDGGAWGAQPNNAFTDPNAADPVVTEGTTGGDAWSQPDGQRDPNDAFTDDEEPDADSGTGWDPSGPGTPGGDPYDDSSSGGDPFGGDDPGGDDSFGSDATGGTGGDW